MMLVLIVLPVAFLLPPRAGAGEIIRGREARPHSRPYMAYLEIQRGRNFSRCGGFLVSKNFVLTAAHCNGQKIMVILGAHDISEPEQSQQVIPARRWIPHPQYDEETDNNDIMLLQLEVKAELNETVGLISLPRARQRVRPRAKCSVAGWGRTSPHNEWPSDRLREVEVEVMPDTDCPRIRNGPYRHYNPSTMLCAGDPHEGKNSFQGDSGGPLVCKKKAHGIVSWGRTNGKPPGVYTRVSTFVPWIEKTMKKLHP